MGYLTDFSMSYECDDDTYDEIASYIDQNNITWVYPDEHETLQWYEWENDLKLVSSRFPDIIFTLEGWGEEHDDAWIAQAKGGEVVKKPILVVYPTFE